MSENVSGPAEPEDLVMTPAGPRAKERVHPVAPGQSVRRVADGSVHDCSRRTRFKYDKEFDHG